MNNNLLENFLYLFLMFNQSYQGNVYSDFNQHMYGL